MFHPLDYCCEVSGRVAELADAQASGACIRKDVGVQVPPRPPAEVLLVRGTSDDSYRTDAPSSAQSTDDSPSDDASTRGAPPDIRHPSRSPQIRTGPVDEVAESVAESINASTGAPVAAGIVWSVTTNGLSLKHQSDTLVANTRGRHTRRHDPQATSGRVGTDPPLPSPYLPSNSPRSLVRSGRLAESASPWRAARSARLGWEPEPLSVELDGPWVVLRPDVSSRARRRTDGRCAYLAAGAGSGVMKGHGRW